MIKIYEVTFNWFTYFVAVHYTACTPIIHREFFEIFRKYFTKYFMKYFTPKNSGNFTSLHVTYFGNSSENVFAILHLCRNSK